ncbi:MAG: class I SAM-dependent DNA methyltransferase [Ilumatobacter sp.]|uniref:class I SAM-dependent DNA methyltransferase n=1 Tax=Ilumatobacter sp. TaxID=1967498 RepID=UPI0039196D5A
MDARGHLDEPDEHLDPRIAAEYDAAVADRCGPDAVDPVVAVLAELAGEGVAVEFAIGTGRIALPLAASGVEVIGLDVSGPMLAELRRKDGAERIEVTVGDMTATRLCSDASLVYLVFNTITNLRSQRQQVACFQNAAGHLRSGGRFVIETGVPKLRRLPPGETIVPFDVSAQHLGFDEYVDLVEQISISHHYFVDGDRVRVVAGAFRYVWPSELDLMAQLAGMTLESRWSDWHRSPFTGDSESHVSVWRKP